MTIKHIMKIVYNRFLPFDGFGTMYFFGILFVRKGDKLSKRKEIHERIHERQCIEMLFIGFYFWYILEWLIRFLFTKDRFSKQAYYSISLEQEAFNHQYFEKYISQRHCYNWFRFYILKK